MTDKPKPIPAVAKPPKDQRIPVMMSVSEVKAIDDWGFANRVRSRSEVVRRLAKIGVAADFEAVMSRGDQLVDLSYITIQSVRYLIEHLDPLINDNREVVQGLTVVAHRLGEICKEINTEAAMLRITQLLPRELHEEAANMDVKDVVSFLRTIADRNGPTSSESNVDLRSEAKPEQAVSGKRKIKLRRPPPS